MDVLSQILTSLKLTSAVYFRADFCAPWGMAIEQSEVAQFHLIVRGQCVVRAAGDRKRKLLGGDIVVFPFGTAHWIADRANSPKLDGKEVLRSIENRVPVFSGEETSTTILCGHFAFDRAFGHPLVSELPDCIFIPDTRRRELPWLESISDLIISETGSDAPGSEAVAGKLAEVLFIHVIRAHVLLQSKPAGFVRSLKDERLSRALHAIHREPERDWTIERLARQSAMSRTLFANRFKQIIGETPFEYLTRWRMLRAMELLRSTGESIVDIAERVGYASEAAFNRAFKRRVHQTPARFRQSANALSLL